MADGVDGSRTMAHLNLGGEAFGGISTSEMADQRPPGGFYRGRKRALRFWYDPKPHYGRVAPPQSRQFSGGGAIVI